MKNRGFRIKTTSGCWIPGLEYYHIQVRTFFGWISIAKCYDKEKAVQIISSLLKPE